MLFTNDELKNKLTPLEYDVTQKCGTEPAFNNEYWNNKEAGLYVDKVSGLPLFTSFSKFDSGSGWPSFTESLNNNSIIRSEDKSLGTKRVELKTERSGSHLGHLFDDGPKDRGGLRYCINSASIKFIKLKDFQRNAYEPYSYLFENKNEEAIVLAGGCFWGMEELFRKQKGVLSTKVVYTGGILENPTYEEVKTGKTGHAEGLLIKFNRKETNLENIINYFFKMHDPTTLNKQGGDIGTQYRSAIFYTTNEQKEKINILIKKIESYKFWKAPIRTIVEQAYKVYDAEAYHQKYLMKNPGGTLATLKDKKIIRRA